jgi:redox-sensitive bicupin YhaK (pirin superfamily)
MTLTRAPAPPTDATARSVTRVVKAVETTEGGGFRVRRPFPIPGHDMADPFLLLDEMGPVSHGPGEAVGAPDHPHRGFETVTYILEGGVEHRDSRGGGGIIGPGDTQWMTAGDGLVHSEMPTEALLRDGGRMHGFQLWVNLPRDAKRKPPAYQDIRADGVAKASLADGRGILRVIAGEIGGVAGPGQTHTPIVYGHVSLQSETETTLTWDSDLTALVYVFGGSARIGAEDLLVEHGTLVLLGAGEAVRLRTDVEGVEALLLGGRPLDEPVARHGPFVMNTRAEILEAIDDFQNGRMGTIGPKTA